MLTYNRYELFTKSLQYFLDQTYENKELIIVNSGNQEYFDKIQLLVKNYSNIKHIHHIKNENETVGHLRNLSLDNATGEYIAVFDDDGKVYYTGNKKHSGTF